MVVRLQVWLLLGADVTRRILSHPCPSFLLRKTDHGGGSGSRSPSENHKLQLERQEVILRVRDLPDCRNFLSTAARSIRNIQTCYLCWTNHRRSQSSIIAAGVVTLSSFSTAHLSHSFLPLATSTVGSDKALEHEKLTCWNRNTNSILRRVFEELYELVGQPVINKLRELGIPERARIWWCSTSVFGSLPLHAMGLN